jgi:hypothetical protein
MFTSRVEGPNWMRQFWRCPKDRGVQCEFFAWIKEMPNEASHAQEARDNHFKNKKKYGQKQSNEAEEREEEFEKIKKTMQKLCPRKKRNKTGSNHFMKMESCTDCGKVLLREKTQEAHDLDQKKNEASSTNGKSEKAASSKMDKSESEIRRRYEAMRKMMEGSSEEEEVSTRGGNRR